MADVIKISDRWSQEEKEKAAERFQRQLEPEEKLLRDGHLFHQDMSEIEKLIQLAKNTAGVIQNKQLGEGYTDGLDD